MYKLIIYTINSYINVKTVYGHQMLKTNPLTRCSKVDGAKKKNYALVLTKKIKQDICLLVYLLTIILG